MSLFSILAILLQQVELRRQLYIYMYLCFPPLGLCNCEDGYSGESCEISKDVVPEIGTVPYICDIDATDDCMSAPVYGFNFVQSSTLTCRYELIKVRNKDTMQFISLCYFCFILFLTRNI